MAKRRNMNSLLQPGEEMIWAGSPCEGKAYGRIDGLLLPLSLALLGVSTFFAVMLVHAIVAKGFHAADALWLAIVLALCAASVYAYFIRFAVKRRRKADLVYGITSLPRVLIRSNDTERLVEISGEKLRHAYISEVDRHGVGTIYFEKKRLGNLLDNAGLDFLTNRRGPRIALYDIEDCKKVYRLIRSKRRTG